MEYTLLSHLYYEQKEKYQEIYEKRFHSEFTTHLPFKIHENEAFYCLCPQILDMQIAIMQADKSIRELCRLLPAAALQQFATRCLIEEIVQTNHIEGVYSTRREINGVLKNLREGGPKRRFFGLVAKYNLLGEDEIPLNTCEDIRHIYDELVLREVKEDDPDNVPDGYLFRKDMAEVTTETGKVIHQGVYPEDRIIEKMNGALRILNDPTIPAIIRISIFHYLFGYIHPFYDGNGRTSRFISSYLLSTILEGLIGYRLSYTIKENISRYYKAFQVCNDEKGKGDITPFILIFMDIIRESMDNLHMALKKRWKNLNAYQQQLLQWEEFRVDEAIWQFGNILLQARLFSEDGITKAELQKELEISPGTVDKRLKRMDELGCLCKKRIGHTYYYEFAIEKLKIE